jgi:phosphogluconate dehydratase
MTMALHPVLKSVTATIVERSRASRSAYLSRVAQAASGSVARARVSCANLAHTIAAEPSREKLVLREMRRPNLAIVSSYNDMLSAHQPLNAFPGIIKAAALEANAVAQFAGGVPAMCDGVTQGQPGMELSLFSRDVIAMATAVALSHNVFDGVLCLGVCDKIVPGLLIGALQFGHLPTIFVPAGPMSSGLSNKEKAAVRQRYARGEIGREELLDAEARAYHGPGTCTFYGTANSNQVLMEAMGLHLPGAAFVPPQSPLREALTAEATRRLVALTAQGSEPTPLARVIDERAIVNGIVALLATGGSTNHTIHLVAIARAAGIRINWEDFSRLSAAVPLLAKIYPNGSADINHFQAAGGVGFLLMALLNVGLLHNDVTTIGGGSLEHQAQEPVLAQGKLTWQSAPPASLDASVLRSAEAPFAPDGGLKILTGNLGRGVIKISAVAPEHQRVDAPALVFDEQQQFQEAFARGELRRDFVAVVRFQGVRANGMPELHMLTPALGSLQDEGFHVALLTDGRMSGASGKVPAAIHVWPEAAAAGPIALLRDGDRIVLDAGLGTLDAIVEAAEWARRAPAAKDTRGNTFGSGRELFSAARALAGSPEEGAMTFGPDAFSETPVETARAAEVLE